MNHSWFLLEFLPEPPAPVTDVGWWKKGGLYCKAKSKEPGSSC